MSQSATVDRRRATARRIIRSARDLAAAHGVDGFTMDQLAEAAEVSRRTLFNYFPGKYDAILGGPPEVAGESVEVFRGGGPTGDLVEDVLLVVEDVLRAREETPAEAALGKRLLEENPALISYALAQLDSCLTELQDHLRARFGATYDPGQGRALLASLIALGHVSMAEYVETDGAVPVHDVFAERLRGLRAVLTRPDLI